MVDVVLGMGVVCCVVWICVVCGFRDFFYGVGLM